MKRILLITLFFGLCFSMAKAQSELIIEENFQQWEPTEDTNPDTCEKGLVAVDSFIYREMSLVTSSGTVPISVEMMKVSISPECGSRRYNDNGTAMPDGVTLGFVQLGKTLLETDTIGEFIFGPVPQIDSIVFAHSATGANRGIRLYKSYDRETWERATLDEFTDGDSQLGTVHKVDINDTCIYIKFTSGIKASDTTSQYSRLHNIQVYGIPGELPVNVNKYQSGSTLSIYPIPASKFVNIKAPVALSAGSLEIYNLLGARVYSREITQQLTRLDLSDFAQGIYVVRLRANNRVYMNQMIIQ